MDKNRIIKNIFMIIQGSLKAFWSATIRTVWGIAGIFLLAGLIKGMSVDASKITSLLSMCIILIEYWIVFWAAYFTRDLYYELRGELSD